MADKGLKRTGLSGVVIGGLALLACELPLILAFIGLGGLSAGAFAFRPSELIELAALGVAAAGALLLLVYIWRQKKTKPGD